MLHFYHRLNHFTSTMSKRYVRTRRVIGRKNLYEDPGVNEDTKKKVMILGSNGALGSSIVQTLKRQNFWVMGVDVTSPRDQNISTTDLFVLLPSNSTLPDMIQHLQTAIKPHNADDNNPLVLDAIICASGGFSMDTENQEDLGHVFEDMMKKNFYPIVAAGEVAKDYMTAENGLLVAIGSLVALNGSTPGMAAYGSSKAAAHHYIQTLGTITGETLSGQSKEKRKSDATVQLLVQHSYLKQLTALAILPNIIDTPSNREAMPHTNFDQWVKPGEIAKEISSWLRVPALRPHSGSLIKIVRKKGLDGQYLSEFQLVR